MVIPICFQSQDELTLLCNVLAKTSHSHPIPFTCLKSVLHGSEKCKSTLFSISTKKRGEKSWQGWKVSGLSLLFENKENLLFLQNRLPRTFSVMFYCFLLLHLPYCFFCFLFLLFYVSTVFCFQPFICSTVSLFPICLKVFRKLRLGSEVRFWG